ncbi:neither inactivation nor afterpotential protein G [Spodoptera frugiperda]|uniref:Neither inactivation nor afterpotential protein G n=1 Tax=Spodoptera frugiperda TaxID=7108 RepID=A0A9R0E9W8_SPOFR|nr:neither inactivation nor afterpotential protein G [Spodoptera frugiperda]
MALYSYLFGLLVACVSYIVYQKYVNVYTSIIIKPQKRYDYIIVGAGTAGCVLASRLSEDPNTKVLLVEAGDHMGYFTKIPLTPTAAQQGPDDWSVRTKPQKYSSFGLWGQSQFIPRGKGLGGSGQINFLLHGTGLPGDYGRWAQLGFKGWTFKDLKPYFIKAFGTVRSEFDSGHCAIDGDCPAAKVPMKLKQIDDDNELMNTFRLASMHSTKNIFRRPTATIKDGARHSTLNAYLKPALGRKNLHVLLRTQAVSIRFINMTASSLYILQNHRELDNIFVNKEIIVAAGAIKSPQLLMLSGIGPPELLRRLKIKLVLPNKEVGRNFHDHMNMPLYVSIQRPISVTLSKVFTFTAAFEYFWKNTGPLSFPPLSGVEYQNSSAVMLFSMGTASERLLRDLSNYKPQVFRDTFPFYNNTNKEGFMFLSTCVQPRSRGTVTLADSTTSMPPVVDPNYLEQYFDVKCMVKAIRRAEELVSTKPFQEIGARIHWPRPERCLSLWRTRIEKEEKVEDYKEDPKKQSQVKEQKPKPKPVPSPPDAYLECIIREVAVTGHHAGGTCAGGRVVDEELRVKSISGLRVMDASVLPSPISLYPNSVIVAMAERAADLIRYGGNK